jgi:hypothetical protein
MIQFCDVEGVGLESDQSSGVSRRVEGGKMRVKESSRQALILSRLTMMARVHCSRLR